MKKLGTEAWILIAVIVIAVIALWIVLAGPRQAGRAIEQPEVRLDASTYDGSMFDKDIYLGFSPTTSPYVSIQGFRAYRDARLFVQQASFTRPGLPTVILTEKCGLRFFPVLDEVDFAVLSTTHNFEVARIEDYVCRLPYVQVTDNFGTPATVERIT